MYLYSHNAYKVVYKGEREMTTEEAENMGIVELFQRVVGLNEKIEDAE
jgi:hypothetical protein